MMTAPTQQEIVLRLVDAPGGACMTTFLHYQIPRYSARIHELREAGWRIDTVRCERHDHHKHYDAYVLNGRQAEYPTDDSGQERIF